MKDQRYNLLYGKPLNVPDMLADGFARGGDKVFALFQRADGTREEYTYRTLEEEAKALLQRLQAAGLQPGDRLGVVSTLRPWWYSLYYAAILGGFRMVCIDPAVPVEQIHTMLRQTEVRAVFTSLPRFQLPAIFEHSIPLYSVSAGFPLMGGSETVDPLLSSASPLPDDTFFILFSSGTTGERRKGVLLRHSTVADAIGRNMSPACGVYKNKPAYSIRNRDLMLFPPFHIAGLLCATFDLYNNTQVIMLERLTPNSLATVLQELKPDNVCTVPAMLTTVMKKVRAGLSGKKLASTFVNGLLDFSGFLRRRLGINIGHGLLKFLNKKALGGNVRGFMIGASPCDEETMRFFLNMGMDVALAYGLTELGAPLAVTGAGYYLGSTGRVPGRGSGMDIRIVNPDARGRGEVEVLSAYPMISYLNEEDNAGCFTEDGYFRTGDIGYYNAEDCLVLCGRAKESIVLRTGEKLLPEEIEIHYDNIEDVTQVCAFRVPGEGGCDAFSLAVVKNKEHGVQDAAVERRVWERVAKLDPMFAPQNIYVLPEFPLSSSHKVQRFRLTEMVEKGFDTPLNDASFRTVSEDGPAGELRGLLVKVGGSQWKTVELNEGLPLNLDSLQTIELYVAIQETFGIDLFTVAEPPATFGELLETVTSFEEVDKNSKQTLDLQSFPQPATRGEHRLYSNLNRLVSTVWNVHGTGMEHIPAEGNFILCSNHVTVLDPAWLCRFLNNDRRAKTAIVGKSAVLDMKGMKSIARIGNLIPVDRTGNSKATLERCRELITEGWSVIIFPEGTNYESGGEMLPLLEGPARLALSTGVPILPAHITGVKAPKDMENHGFLPPVGGRVNIAFGEPIDPAGLDVTSLNEKLRAAIESL